ncbi:Thioredoxin domain-containing protein [Spironucleus salmonicida]|uniref:Thioredoxin domain-containing protein n=1 Tax=Spironucleus salmonicida TaxID=348837 RepID=V6LY33_9EUKA|nr:Thioredoxin domain-containing protein [Spironucleus salmonicida]KAH0577384.1 Thioredoxin domain-containing protein [Spironucleus salmonicida]KAH0577398.1 Thioredoxin domain-containing protein [Spironucleus salmonicida]|eukprot:EST48927.1 Thioredoxin domain-containing protein [Spironucleus salmonicida]
MNYAQYETSDWYEPVAAAVAALQAHKDLSITVVHADWCGDCTYTLPLLKKIVAALPAVKIVDVVVDRQKNDPQGIAKRLGVTNIPTLVVFKGAQEVGRIVESPKATIEEDIVAMLAK